LFRYELTRSFRITVNDDISLESVILKTLKLRRLLLLLKRAVKLDSVDKVIWVLPVLGVLDVISTFYANSLGYPPMLYEAGILARYFANFGLTYIYIPIYLAILIMFSYIFWYVKNEKLDSSRFLDKILFFLLLGAVFYVYMRLTVAFSVNFLLPFLISGKLSLFLVDLLIYLSTAFTLILYTWHDAVKWIGGSEESERVN